MGVSIQSLMMDRGGVVKQCFAVVHSPKKRKRLSANCVTEMPSEAAAIEAADVSNNRFPAIVAGPSTSSESQKLYYLVKWLD